MSPETKRPTGLQTPSSLACDLLTKNTEHCLKSRNRNGTCQRNSLFRAQIEKVEDLVPRQFDEFVSIFLSKIPPHLQRA